MRDDPDARDYDLTGLKGTAEFAISDAETLSADLWYTLKTKRELRELPFFVSRLRQTDSESRESKAPQLIVNGVQDGNGHSRRVARLTNLRLYRWGADVRRPAWHHVCDD